MSAIALVGAITLLLPEQVIHRIILPLVALAAGSLLGGAIFHMLPLAIDSQGNQIFVYLWFAIGFSIFFCLEQFLQWHHCHHTTSQHIRPVGCLILIADGLHNLIGGFAVAGAFLIDLRTGIGTWIAAAAHEIPQEIGDFGILIYSGWKPRRALLFNLLSALSFLVGSIIAFIIRDKINTGLVIAFGAGNFVYIAAADLIPEVSKNSSWKKNLKHFIAFICGLGLLLLIKIVI
jgi:zinc and cadmium transporter